MKFFNALFYLVKAYNHIVHDILCNDDEIAETQHILQNTDIIQSFLDDIQDLYHVFRPLQPLQPLQVIRLYPMSCLF